MKRHPRRRSATARPPKQHGPPRKRPSAAIPSKSTYPGIGATGASPAGPYSTTCAKAVTAAACRTVPGWINQRVSSEALVGDRDMEWARFQTNLQGVSLGKTEAPLSAFESIANLFQRRLSLSPISTTSMFRPPHGKAAQWLPWMLLRLTSSLGCRQFGRKAGWLAERLQCP